MNIYINEDKDAELLRVIREESKRRKRSMTYVIKEKLRTAFGIKGEA